MAITEQLGDEVTVTVRLTHMHRLSFVNDVLLSGRKPKMEKPGPKVWSKTWSRTPADLIDLGRHRGSDLDLIIT